MKSYPVFDDPPDPFAEYADDFDPVLTAAPAYDGGSHRDIGAPSYGHDEGGFEFTDAWEGPYDSGEVHFSDGLEGYDEVDEVLPAYEDIYEEEYGIPDEEEYYEELVEDDWIPYALEEIPDADEYELPDPSGPVNRGGQQIIIGGSGGLPQYPDPASLREHYCILHPAVCENGTGLAGREGMGNGNGTTGWFEERSLKDIDMSGVGLAVLLLLLLLFGLQGGKKSDDPPAKGDDPRGPRDPRDPSDPRKKVPKVAPTDDTTGNPADPNRRTRTTPSGADDTLRRTGQPRTPEQIAADEAERKRKIDEAEKEKKRKEARAAAEAETEAKKREDKKLIDSMSPSDRAKYDAMSPREQAKHLDRLRRNREADPANPDTSRTPRDDESKKAAEKAARLKALQTEVYPKMSKEKQNAYNSLTDPDKKIEFLEREKRKTGQGSDPPRSDRHPRTSGTSDTEDSAKKETLRKLHEEVYPGLTKDKQKAYKELPDTDKKIKFLQAEKAKAELAKRTTPPGKTPETQAPPGGGGGRGGGGGGETAEEQKQRRELEKKLRPKMSREEKDTLDAIDNPKEKLDFLTQFKKKLEGDGGKPVGGGPPNPTEPPGDGGQRKRETEAERAARKALLRELSGKMSQKEKSEYEAIQDPFEKKKYLDELKKRLEGGPTPTNPPGPAVPPVDPKETEKQRKEREAKLKALKESMSPQEISDYRKLKTPEEKKKFLEELERKREEAKKTNPTGGGDPSGPGTTDTSQTPPAAEGGATDKAREAKKQKILDEMTPEHRKAYEELKDDPKAQEEFLGIPPDKRDRWLRGYKDQKLLDALSPEARARYDAADPKEQSRIRRKLREDDAKKKQEQIGGQTEPPGGGGGVPDGAPVQNDGLEGNPTGGADAEEEKERKKREREQRRLDAMTPEEREKYQKRKQEEKDLLDKCTPEEQKAYEEMTSDQKSDFRRKKRAEQKKKDDKDILDKLTPEEQKAFSKMSPEEKEKFLRKKKAEQKKKDDKDILDQLTPEEREAYKKMKPEEREKFMEQKRNRKKAEEEGKRQPKGPSKSDEPDPPGGRPADGLSSTTNDGGGGTEDDDGDGLLSGISKPTGALLLLLLLPLLGVLARGTVSIPSGQALFSAPSLPKLNIPKPSMPSLGSSASRSTWVVKEPKPQPKAEPKIMINNINNAGAGDPVQVIAESVGASPKSTLAAKTVIKEEKVEVLEEIVTSGSEVVAESAHVTVEEQVVIETPIEPVKIQFSGPSNPDRVIGMFFALIVISIPLLLDMAYDWRLRKFVEPNYLPGIVHSLIFLLLGLLLLWKADEEFGWSSRYGPYVKSITTTLPKLVSPLVVSTIEGGESLVWGLEDAVFGEAQQLLGMALAAVGMVALSQKSPSHFKAGDNGHHDVSIQLLGLVGFVVIAFLLLNA